MEIGLFLAHRHFRLARKSGAGLSCDADGVLLGGVQLLRKTDAGFEPRSLGQLDVLAKAAFGAAFDTPALRRGLAVAATAMNEGDLARAMVATLHLRLPELDDKAPGRLAAVDAVLAKYSPDEPRDWHGRWTTEGGGTGGSGEQVPTRPPKPVGAGAGAQSSGDHTSRPTGGHLFETRYQEAGDDDDVPGIGDNGPPPQLQSGRGQAPQPDPVLPAEKVPPGWDRPARTVDGKQLPAERVPTLPDGRLWPTAAPDEILRVLKPSRGTTPVMKIYVPRDGEGPMLIGSNDKEEFLKPPGYDTVYLRGSPQMTFSGGAETAHARESVVEALSLAKRNEFSDIYFNRSLSTISNGIYRSPLRPDVVAVYRPGLDTGPGYAVREILSPRQSGAERERVLRPAASAIRDFDSRAYKLLLKLLRALGIS